MDTPTQPVALPPVPRDMLVYRPAAPVFPPTFQDIMAAKQYLQDVEWSISDRPSCYNCTEQDRQNAIRYEESIQEQVAPFVSQEPEPPWFQAAWQQLTADIINDAKLVLSAEILSVLQKDENLHRGDGTFIPYHIVPFADGTDPIEPPHNLTPLRSLDVIDNLDGNELVAYLQGYGMSTLPLGEDPVATDCLRKEKLKGMVRGI